MKKDIPELAVIGVAIAIVKEMNKEGVYEWNAYLLNLRDEKMEGVLITSTGYGMIEGEKRITSTLRHFLDTLAPNSYKKFEPLIEDVFGLTNEYWLSFFENRQMYDKKYIFLPESITEANLTTIPLIKKKGVMIR